MPHSVSPEASPAPNQEDVELPDANLEPVIKDEPIEGQNEDHDMTEAEMDEQAVAQESESPDTLREETKVSLENMFDDDGEEDEFTSSAPVVPKDEPRSSPPPMPM
jgi:hypothetical protein